MLKLLLNALVSWIAHSKNSQRAIFGASSFPFWKEMKWNISYFISVSSQYLLESYLVFMVCIHVCSIHNYEIRNWELSWLMFHSTISFNENSGKLWSIILINYWFLFLIQLTMISTLTNTNMSIQISILQFVMCHEN